MKAMRIIVLAACVAGFVLLVTLTMARATPPKAPERIPVVMVGDRVVDIALKLGVIPEGMSVRLSMWPDKAKALPVASQVLGCPNCVTRKRPDAVASFMKSRGITRLILEKNPQFCLYMKNVNPVDVAELVKDVPGVTIEYVDFSKGIPEAIARTAALLGRVEQGRQVAAGYAKAMQAMKKKLAAKGCGKRVLVLNGSYFPMTGKTIIRVETPGGYSDRFILDPLGCTNAAGAMLTDTMKVSKGHVPAGRLGWLATVQPDVIVATGNGFAVQKALHDALKKHPGLASVPALRNAAVYSLPFYGDSSVLEYPQILEQWRVALED